MKYTEVQRMRKTGGYKWDSFLDSLTPEPGPVKWIAGAIGAPSDEWMKKRDNDGLLGKLTSLLPYVASWRMQRRAAYGHAKAKAAAQAAK